MRRLLLALAGLLVGALVGGSVLLGSQVAVEPAAPHSEPLRLLDHCRQEHGAGATDYRPHKVTDWSCSYWKDGTWRLTPADLPAVCRRQRGEEATLGDQITATHEVGCTL